jgi:hypothetical protein
MNASVENRFSHSEKGRQKKIIPSAQITNEKEKPEERRRNDDMLARVKC